MNEIRTARDRLDRIVSLVGRAARFWPAAAIVLAIGTIISGGVAFTRPRIYKSETLILYREGIRSSDLGGADAGGVDGGTAGGGKVDRLNSRCSRVSTLVSRRHARVRALRFGDHL